MKVQPTMSRQPGDSGPGPLWRRIRKDLQDRVAAGDFGDTFPGEMELSRQYGASRHTIREALRALRLDGTVTAARGRTSRVAAPTPFEQPAGALYSLFASVEAVGHTQRSVVLHCDLRADAVVATRLGLDGWASLVYLERLRLADEQPLAVDRVWLPASWATPLLDIDFGRTSLYEQMRTRCGVELTGGQERIRAVAPTTAEQHLLDSPPQVAALALDRLGCQGGIPAEWRHTLIRGDKFSLTAQFTPSSYRFTTTGSTDPAFPAPQGVQP